MPEPSPRPRSIGSLVDAGRRAAGRGRAPARAAGRARCGGFKIGSQLFTAAGPVAIEHALQKRGYRVFLDLKYHDIPNTVTGAAREATRLGVFMFNVHASGGARHDARGGRRRRRRRPATSRARGRSARASPCSRASTARALETEARRGRDRSQAHVLRLAELAREAGLDGCVASPAGDRAARAAPRRAWVIVTPGIRPRRARRRPVAHRDAGRRRARRRPLPRGRTPHHRPRPIPSRPPAPSSTSRHRQLNRGGGLAWGPGRLDEGHCLAERGTN